MTDAMAANEDRPGLRGAGTDSRAGDRRGRRRDARRTSSDVGSPSSTSSRTSEAAVRELLAADPVTVDSVLTGVLDAAGHRLDVWYTAIAHRRLQQLQAVEATPVLGAYGWVDDLRPSRRPDPADDRRPDPRAQSTPRPSPRPCCATMPSTTPNDERWKLTLDSAIGAARRRARPTRCGRASTSREVLGREIERRFPEPDRVLALREKYPARPEWAGRRVCDGQQVLADARDNPRQLPPWLQPARRQGPAATRSTRTPTCWSPTRCTPSSRAGPMRPPSRSRPPRAWAHRPSCGCCAPSARARPSPPTCCSPSLAARPGRRSRSPPTTSPVAVADPAFARWLAGELGRPRTLTWTDHDAPDPLGHPGRSCGLTLPETLLYPARSSTSWPVPRLARPTTSPGPAPLGRHRAPGRARARRAARPGCSRRHRGAAGGRRAPPPASARLRRMATSSPDARWTAASRRARDAAALVARLRRVGAARTDLARAREELGPHGHAGRRRRGTAAELARRIRQLVPRPGAAAARLCRRDCRDLRQAPGC